MQNKRKFQRVTIKAVSEIYCLDDKRRFKGFLGGISRGGLEIYSSEQVSKGCRLEIAIHFMDKNGRPVQENVTGHVRWSAPMESDYIAGIEFARAVDSKQNPALADYIRTAEEYLEIH